MMWNFDYGYIPMHPFGMLINLIWWILVIWAVIAFIRWMKHDGKTGLHRMMGNRALDLLKERYAKGEIDKAEFEEKKKDLE